MQPCHLQYFLSASPRLVSREAYASRRSDPLHRLSRQSLPPRYQSSVTGPPPEATVYCLRMILGSSPRACLSETRYTLTLTRTFGSGSCASLASAAAAA